MTWASGRFQLHEVEGSTVDLDEAAALLAVGNSGGILLHDANSKSADASSDTELEPTQREMVDLAIKAIQPHLRVGM